MFYAFSHKLRMLRFPRSTCSEVDVIWKDERRDRAQLYGIRNQPLFESENHAAHKIFMYDVRITTQHETMKKYYA